MIIYSLIFIGILLFLSGLLIYKNEFQFIVQQDKKDGSVLYSLQQYLGRFAIFIGLFTFFLPLLTAFFGNMAISMYAVFFAVGVIRLFLKYGKFLFAKLSQEISSLN
ncbi:MAG: hypothetical protein ACQEQG_05185 [Bacillota bacterium]